MVDISGIYWFALLMLLNVVYIKAASGFTWGEMLRGLKKVKND